MWEAGPNAVPTKEENSINHQLSQIKGELSTDEARIAFAKFCYANPHFTCDLLMGVDIFELQEIIIRTVFKKDFSMFVLSRGGSKSYTSAILICLYAIFNPGTKIVVTAKNARQTRAIFNQIEKFATARKGGSMNTGGKFLMDCLKKNSQGNSFHRNTDGWNIQFVGGSSVVFLPLGNGDQITKMKIQMSKAL